MSDHEQRALARIDQETDPDRLLAYARNAHEKSPAVARAAVRRLAAVSAKHAPGTVENACWTMVHTIECTSSDVLRQVGSGFSGELASSGVDI